MSEGVETGVVLIPLLSRGGPDAEYPIHDGAVGVLAVVDGNDFAIQVHYVAPIDAPVIPRRITVANGNMARIYGGRHLASLWWRGLPWHLFVETGEG